MTPEMEQRKLRIIVNSNSHMTRGKYAAAAVHAALTAAGVHPGLPVIVLGGQRDDVLRCSTIIRDAGKTEVEPGTPTAGTDWSPAPITDADVDASALRGEPVALSLFRMFVREHDEGDGPERVTVEVADLRTVLRELEAAREVHP